MSENIINWTDEDGKEFNVPLINLQLAYEFTQPFKNTKRNRKFQLEAIFQSTYHAALQSGADIVDAIAKAMKAVALAGKYDEAMKQSVEARLNAEFHE